MKTVYAINFYTNTICLVVSDFSLLYMYMISCVLSTMKLNEFFLLCYVMLLRLPSTFAIGVEDTIPAKDMEAAKNHMSLATSDLQPHSLAYT